MAVALVIVTSCPAAHAEAVRTVVAVIRPVDLSGRQPDPVVDRLERQLRDAVAATLSPSRYTVLTAEAMEALMPAAERPMCLDAACLADVGREMQADIVVGEWLRTGADGLRLRVVSIRVSDGVMLGEAETSGGDLEAILSGLRSAAGTALGAVAASPGGMGTGETGSDGGVAGGAMGGVAGGAMGGVAERSMPSSTPTPPDPSARAPGAATWSGAPATTVGHPLAGGDAADRDRNGPDRRLEPPSRPRHMRWLRVGAVGVGLGGVAAGLALKRVADEAYAAYLAVQPGAPQTDFDARYAEVRRWDITRTGLLVGGGALALLGGVSLAIEW